jgi:DNA-binding response OmpR family regulator
METTFKYMPGRPLVLVNESDKDIRELIAHVLKCEGYKVVVGKDGDEAVRISRMVLPDLIIMNLMLPKMNGGQVFKALRADPKTETIKVLLLSAKQTADQYCPGVDSFISKPFDVWELLYMIAKLVGFPSGG